MYILYNTPFCPYCQKVVSFSEEKGIELTLRNINEGDHRADLIERGGKATVPYLVDDSNGTEMYESDDIITYLGSRIDA